MTTLPHYHESMSKATEVKTMRQRRELASVERAIAAWAKELPKEKRLLLGKFVGLRCKQGFETGLAIGLTILAVRNPVELPDETEATPCE